MRRNVGGLYFVLSPCLFITSNCPAVLDCVLLLPTVSTRVTRPFYRIGAEIARIYLSPQNFILFLFHFVSFYFGIAQCEIWDQHGSAWLYSNAASLSAGSLHCTYWPLQCTRSEWLAVVKYIAVVPYQ